MNIHKPGDYFVLPIGMCEYVVRNKLFRTFQVYTYLKLSSSGKVYFHKNAKADIATQLDISIRTVEFHISRLIELQWIGRNRDIIYVRAFDSICFKYGLDNKIGVVFYSKDIKSFKAFVIGSIVGYVINGIRIKNKRERSGLGSRSNGGRDISTKSGHFQYVQLANCIVANICKCAMSTASKYKELLVAKGYISLEHTYSEINIKSNQYWQYKKYAPQRHTKHVFIKDNKVIERLPDLAMSLLKFKYRSGVKKRYIK